MLNTVFHYDKWLANWTDLIQMSERSVHDIKVNIVTWSRLIYQWLKVNTDGSAITNRGMLGAGGILRDKNGRLVMAFTTPH